MPGADPGYVSWLGSVCVCECVSECARACVYCVCVHSHAGVCECMSVCASVCACLLCVFTVCV